jgi:hypothetical protein
VAMLPPPGTFKSYAPKVKMPKVAAPKPPRVAPPTDLQLAQQQVQAAYDPILRQITQAYNQQATASGAAINQGSQQLAGLYGQAGPAEQAAYDRAAQSMAAISGMLANVRSGQGAAAQADLAHQLQGIDANTVGRVSGDFGNALQGEALANATRGGNNLAALLAEGAHAGQWASGLPAIGGQVGFNSLRSNEAQINNQLAAALSGLTAKEPGDIQSAISQIQTNRNQSKQLAFENSLKTKNANTSAARAAAPKIVHTADGSVVAVNPTTGQTVGQISGPRAPKPTKPTTFKGTDGQTYVYDPKSGTAKAIAGQSGPKSRSGGFSPSQVARYSGQALTLADSAYHGGTDSKGNALPQLTYQQAVLEARKAGIPAPIAVKALDQFYAMGERGRPYSKRPLPAAQRKAITGAAKTISGLFGG